MSVISASKAQGLGTKRNCRSCGARFYDFNKSEPSCPKCAAIFDVNAEPEPQLAPLTPEELAEMKAEDEERSRKAKRKKEQPARESDDDRRYDDGRDDDD